MVEKRGGEKAKTGRKRRIYPSDAGVHEFNSRPRYKTESETE